MRSWPIAPLSLAVCLAVSALVTACGGASPEGDGESQESLAHASCAEPSQGTALLLDEAGGYCFLYPDSHDVFEPDSERKVIAVDSIVDVQHPRLYLSVEPAAGKPLEKVADDEEALFAGLGVERTSVTVGGLEGVVLDDVPGQDTSRLLLVTASDTLYRFSFVPVGSGYGELSAQTDELYQLVTDSIVFFTPEK